MLKIINCWCLVLAVSMNLWVHFCQAEDSNVFTAQAEYHYSSFYIEKAVAIDVLQKAGLSDLSLAGFGNSYFSLAVIKSSPVAVQYFTSNPGELGKLIG